MFFQNGLSLIWNYLENNTKDKKQNVWSAQIQVFFVMFLEKTGTMFQWGRKPSTLELAKDCQNEG